MVMLGNLNLKIYKIGLVLILLLVFSILCYTILYGNYKHKNDEQKKIEREKVEKYYKYVQSQQRANKKERDENISAFSHKHDSQNILDGCYHVYLDVGSNIGVQVRKLFEPNKYPEAKIHEIFNSEFGPITTRQKFSKERTICAIGFEPNAHHTKYLKQIERSYNKCGWKVFLMTETAVSNREGTTIFYSDEDYENLEWGGGILPPSINKVSVDKSANKKGQYEVNLVRLSSFINDIVGKRKLPVKYSDTDPPKVVMKIDIEGSELDVVPDLIFKGALQYINVMITEWHPNLEKIEERVSAHKHLQKSLTSLSGYVKTMESLGGVFSFKLVDLDDETYVTSMLDLPQC